MRHEGNDRIMGLLMNNLFCSATAYSNSLRPAAKPRTTTPPLSTWPCVMMRASLTMTMSKPNEAAKVASSSRGDSSVHKRLYVVALLNAES